MSGVTPPILWETPFADLYRDALDRIKVNAPEYTALVPADPGIAVLDALLYQAALLGERLNLLPYAALVAWINYLGLQKKGPVAATGAVRVSLAEAAPRDLLIPQGTRFLDEDGLGFLSSAEVIVHIGETSAEITCVAELKGAVGNVAAHRIVALYQLLPFVRSVDNIESFAGGVDSELDSDALDRGRALLTHLWRAVTPADYEALAISVPGIGRAKAIDAAGIVRLYLLAEDGQAANQALIQDALRFIEPRRLQGVMLQALPALIVPVPVRARVRLLPGATLQTVQTLAQAALAQALSPRVWIWGRKVSIAELFATLEAVGGIDYVEELLIPQANLAIARLACGMSSSST